MTSHDHQLARLAPCEACGASSGARCRNWTGAEAAVPCAERLAALRTPRPVLLCGTWLDELERQVA